MLGCLRRASLNIGGSTHPTLSCVDQDRLWIMDITSRHMMLLLLSRFIPRVTLPHGVTQVKLLHNELCLGLLERNSISPYCVISENTSPLSLWEDTGRCPEIENGERRMLSLSRRLSHIPWAILFRRKKVWGPGCSECPRPRCNLQACRGILDQKAHGVLSCLNSASRELNKISLFCFNWRCFLKSYQ